MDGAARAVREGGDVMQPDGPLFAWQPPPASDAPIATSPTPERFKRAKGEPRDYRAEFDAWRERNPEIATHIEWLALVELRSGATRIEVNAIFAAVRARYVTTLNNSWRAACADWLVEREPRLATLIERRARRRTK
jgi:hypothetical protein